MIPRLKELYTKQIRSELKKKFSFKNSYMAPKIEKIFLSLLDLSGFSGVKIEKKIDFNKLYNERIN